ncbi:unnamed protein product [Paramecium sonneborni]|uniref:H-type lectin domain-containing protein n=1 Tax=Paramecium sonneborni TaxID=65129 RepID=A0A8S1PDQ9_9CILI|nr:unnamed protein product [Paramecium sonneborni]
MRILIFNIIFYIIYGYRYIQYETGNKILAPGSTGHILETTQTLPRYLEVDIQFQTPFVIEPQVFLSISLIDSNRTDPSGFIEKVRLVTTTGFKVRINAVSKYGLHGLAIDWYAFDDSRIQVITFESSNLQELSTGSGERKIYFTLNHNLEDATRGVISQMGIIHKFDDQKVELNIEQITQNSVTVSVRTDHQTQIDYIKFNVLLGTDQSLWTSSIRDYLVASNHHFIYNNRLNNYFQAAKEELQIPFPSEWYTDISVPMFIMRGYHNFKGENIRVFYQDQRFQQNHIFATIGTWWNSTLYEFFYQGAIYYPDPNYRNFDLNCAEFFSECNFNGDSFIICDKIQDLSGLFKPIKSISIPIYRKLNLFNEVNYKGNKISFVQNQQCISLNDKLSAKFQPIISFIKIFFFDTDINPTCFTVTFYNQCNYSGISYTVRRGEHLKLSNQIPFQIKSIKLCPFMVVRFKDPKFSSGITQEYTSSQTCLDNYQFPKYRSSN